MRTSGAVRQGFVACLVLGVLACPAGAAHPDGCPSGNSGYRAGSAKADITPTQWPVAEAAYGIGRVAVAAAHPFYARSLAIQSCSNGDTVVLTALDSQGYFAAYKEDPGAGIDGFGTAAIRQAVERDTGVAASHILIASTHTHNSPDSVGVWGGGSSANNKAPYLQRVRDQTIASIEGALSALRPAHLRVGTADLSALLGTYPEVRRDPRDYPTDHTLRVLQATDTGSCAAIFTLVNAGIHADVAGPIDQGHGQLIDPDWPGRVANVLEREMPGDTPVIMAGAVGRTGPSFPSGTDPNSKDPLAEVAAYGDVLSRRVDTALAGSTPVPDGPVQTVESHRLEEIAQPALIPLFASETGVPGQLGGVMRSILPPYSIGNALDADIQTFRVGSLMLAGAPGEAYPEVATELAKRVPAGAPPFVFGLANDQLGYTPPAFEYPVVALADGGDEGFFTINSHFGDDVINQHLAAAGALGFGAMSAYDGASAGPVVPPDQRNPPPPDPNPPEPAERALDLHCTRSGAPSSAADAVTTTITSRGTQLVSGYGGQIELPSASRCLSRRSMIIHLRRRPGLRVLRVRVTVNGRAVRPHFGRRLGIAVRLRGLPRGRFTVHVVMRVRSAGSTHTLRASRTYRTCRSRAGARRRARRQLRNRHRKARPA